MRLNRFWQINLETSDIASYDNDCVLDKEFHFTPIYVDEQTVDLFIHLRYVVIEGEDIEESIYHADFISTFDMTESAEWFKVGEDDQYYIQLAAFNQLLFQTILLTNGYLTCQNKGTFLLNHLIPFTQKEEINNLIAGFFEIHTGGFVTLETRD